MMKRLTQIGLLGLLFAGGYILAAPRAALCGLTGYECDTMNFRVVEHCASDPETSEFGAIGNLVSECGPGGCCSPHCNTRELGEEYCTQCSAYATMPVYNGDTGTVIINGDNGQPPAAPLQRGRNPVGG